jgi:hypothetical protein
MQRFRRMSGLQKFASVHASIHNHFNQERHLISRSDFKRIAPLHLRSGVSSAVPERQSEGIAAARSSLSDTALRIPQEKCFDVFWPFEDGSLPVQYPAKLTLVRWSLKDAPSKWDVDKCKAYRRRIFR